MTFDSTKQAASALGMSAEFLISAKRLGCPSFRNGRVYTPRLIDWLYEHRRSIADDLACRITWIGFMRIDKRMVAKMRKNLTAIDQSIAPSTVDPLDGLAERIVGLNAEQ